MKPRDLSPPRLAVTLLSWCFPPGDRGQVVVGDLHEAFLERAEAGKGRLGSTLWYWSQVPRLGVPYLLRRIIRRRLYRSLFNAFEEPAAIPPKGFFLNDIFSDVRFAIRSFVRTPGLAISATLILGIGIGSISLMFSILNTAVLQPLPFEDPDELVWVWGESERSGQNSVAYLDYLDFREETEAFESLGGFLVFAQTQFLTGQDEAERVFAQAVTSEFFQVLGVAPEIGRSFLPDEVGAGNDPVAILSHALWMRRFGGDPGVVGTVISLESQPTEVVGVMPSWFDFPAGADLWVPIQPDAGYSQGRGNNNYFVVGRLRDGISIEQAQSQMDVVAANIADTYVDTNAGWGVSLVTLHERLYGSARDMLLILVGIVSLVPVVACANVASLFLARAATRSTEMASRLAVGASRSRLVRQLLTESLVVSLGGGVVGLALAYGGGLAFRSFAPTAVPRLQSIGIDGTVLAFTLLASFLMVPLFGVLPALRGTDLGISETLKAGGGRGGSQRRSAFRNGLVVAQVALSLMLLMASGLLVRSFRNLEGQDLGFRSESLLFARVTLPRFKYQEFPEVQADWDEFYRLLAGYPGVQSVGAVDRPPLGGIGPTNDLWAAERPPTSALDRMDATRRFVTEDYFDVMGIRLLAGRSFEITDGQSSEEDPPVVINEALAQQFFPGEDPVGKTLVFDYDIIRNLEVVGIVADIKEGDLALDPFPAFYLPAQWRPRLYMNVFLRTQGDPLEFASALRQTVETVDPNIPIPTVQTMEGHLGRSLFQPRFRSVLVGLFALVAMALSAIGLYGVLACFVRGRVHEIGIRVALGAGAKGTAGLVLRRGMTLVGSGILVGLGGALAGGQIIQSWLFGVGAIDPLTAAGVTILLTGVALTACLVPTLRALRVDPVEVLKAE